MHSTLSSDAPPQMLAEIWELALAPLPGQVILRAEHDPATQGGLWTPSLEDTYPQVGRVVATSAKEEEIRLGDLALIEVESADIARSYYQVFEVCFRDGTSMLCDPDKADPILEAYSRYKATGTDLRVRLLDLAGAGIQFETSDILAYQFGEMSNPGWSILYPQRVRMFKKQFAGEPLQLYYCVAEEDILCLLK